MTTSREQLFWTKTFVARPWVTQKGCAALRGLPPLKTRLTDSTDPYRSRDKRQISPASASVPSSARFASTPRRRYSVHLHCNQSSSSCPRVKPRFNFRKANIQVLTGGNKSARPWTEKVKNKELRTGDPSKIPRPCWKCAGLKPESPPHPRTLQYPRFG